MMLKDMVSDGYYPSLVVDPSWYEGKHPQESLPEIEDPVSLWRPAPERDLSGGTLTFRPGDGLFTGFAIRCLSIDAVDDIPAPDPDIDAYTLTTADIPFTIAGNNHLTPIFNIAGDRVYFSRTTSWETWQYSMSTPGNLASLSFELTHQWGVNTQFQRGMTLNKDRSKAYKIRTVSSSGDQFISADPFSVTELGEVAGGNPEVLTGVSGLSVAIGTPTSPVSFVVTPDDLNLFVQSIDPGDRAIYHYQMSVAGDAGTATSQGQALDASSEFATRLLGIIYTPDGSKLFVLGDDGGTLRVAQYDLSTAYDVNTAVYSGIRITVTPLSETLLSLFVWANPSGGFKLYLTWPTGGASNGSAWRYDLYDAP
jgi:hypothetical protein